MAMHSLSKLISEHPFFQGLDLAIIETIAGCGQNIRLEAGSYLYREGDAASHFYLLRDGEAALESFAPGRGVMTLQTLRAGDVLGVSWLVAPHRTQFDAHILAAGRAIKFDAACLREKCDRDPVVGYALMKQFMPTLVERMNAARLKAIDIYAPPIEGKSAS